MSVPVDTPGVGFRSHLALLARIEREGVLITNGRALTDVAEPLDGGLAAPEALATLVGLVADTRTRIVARHAYALPPEVERDDDAVSSDRALWGAPARPCETPEGHPRDVSPALRREQAVSAGLLAAQCTADATRRMLDAAGAIGGDEPAWPSALPAYGRRHGAAGRWLSVAAGG